ncbi:ATP-binding protein [bacterium]|nr:ATP-binding protein [bacterium]
MPKTKAWLAWSSGKDSAWALHHCQQQGELEIIGLLTTVTQSFQRVSMHGVRKNVLQAQAQAAQLPLLPVYIPSPCSNAEYEAAMRQAMSQAIAQGVQNIVFGDLFLEDVREYRKQHLQQMGMQAHFPLWGKNTAQLAQNMIQSGLGAYITCCDPKKVPASISGLRYDLALLANLPKACDPCGENGEFHTLVYAGPMFTTPLEVIKG